MHIPVLVNEVINFLRPENGKVYVDATIGCGGYTEKIFKVCPGCRVIGIDWDEQALEFTKNRLKEFLNKGKLIIVKDNFVNIKNILKNLKIDKIDGIVFDFGLSMLQIKGNRGFSFNDNVLDMRMGTVNNSLTAYEIINKFSEKQLSEIFFKYGEEKFSKIIARKIVEERKTKEIKTAKELAEIILKVIPKYKKVFLKYKIHPATRIFQAIRIFINNELQNIELGLNNSIDVLNSRGRIIAVSYHSLEDRIVKNIFKNRTDCKVITKKPITPSKEEISYNRSSRSAKLRAAEKFEEQKV